MADAETVTAGLDDAAKVKLAAEILNLCSPDKDNLEGFLDVLDHSVREELSNRIADYEEAEDEDEDEEDDSEIE